MWLKNQPCLAGMNKHMRWFSHFHDGILVFSKASLLASPSSQDHTDFGQCFGSKLVPMLGMPRIRNIQFRLVCSSGSIVGACQRCPICPMSMDVQHQSSAVFTFFISRFFRRVVWHRNFYLFCALQMPSLYTSHGEASLGSTLPGERSWSWTCWTTYYELLLPWTKDWYGSFGKSK